MINGKDMAWAVRGALAVTMACMAPGACTTSEKSPNAEDGDDGGSLEEGERRGGKGGGMDTGPGADGGSGSGDDGSTGDDAGCVSSTSPCGSAPALFPADPGVIYCGVNGTMTLNCSAGQECCVGGMLSGGSYAPQECETFGQSCSNGSTSPGGTPGLPMECNQTADCSADEAGAACCLRGGAPTAPACSWPRYAGGDGIFCESACASGEVQVCSSQADCPSGTTCTAGKWKVFEIGFCIAEIACGGGSGDASSGQPDSGSGETDTGPSCLPDGEFCDVGTDKCCSTPDGHCNGGTLTCGCSVAGPYGGGKCITDEDCCSGTCGIDGTAECCSLAALGDSCGEPSDCCSGYCGPMGTCD